MIKGKLFGLVFFGCLFFSLYGLDIREDYPVLQNFSREGDVISPFNISELLQFFEDVTSDEFEWPYTSEEEEFVMNLMIKLARIGAPESAQAELERDIAEMLAEE